MSLQMQFCVNDHFRCFLGLPGSILDFSSGQWSKRVFIFSGERRRSPSLVQGSDREVCWERCPPQGSGPGLDTNSIFFRFLFVKTHWFAWRADQWPPHRGNTILFRSSQQLPRLRLGPSTRLVRCFRNYRDTRTPSGVGREARRSQDTVNNNWRKPWLCVCRKRTFLHRSLIVKSQQKKIELVTRPGGIKLGCGDHWCCHSARSRP